MAVSFLDSTTMYINDISSSQWSEFNIGQCTSCYDESSTCDMSHIHCNSSHEDISSSEYTSIQCNSSHEECSSIQCNSRYEEMLSSEYTSIQCNSSHEEYSSIQCNSSHEEMSSSEYTSIQCNSSHEEYSSIQCNSSHCSETEYTTNSSSENLSSIFSSIDDVTSVLDTSQHDQTQSDLSSIHSADVTIIFEHRGDVDYDVMLYSRPACDGQTATCFDSDTGLDSDLPASDKVGSWLQKNHQDQSSINTIDTTAPSVFSRQYIDSDVTSFMTRPMVSCGLARGKVTVSKRQFFVKKLKKIGKLFTKGSSS